MAIVVINKTMVKWGQLGKYYFFSGSPTCVEAKLKKAANERSFKMELQ